MVEIRAERPMNDDEFLEFCARNAALRIERDATGAIVILPPAGFETGYRNNEVCRQLGNWARVDGRGVALDSNTEYLLPNGCRRLKIKMQEWIANGSQLGWLIDARQTVYVYRPGGRPRTEQRK